MEKIIDFQNDCPFGRKEDRIDYLLVIEKMRKINTTLS
jgi:hypothetical protein